MCRAKDDPTCPGGRRCPDGNRWCVNKEGHERQISDPDQERRWVKPKALRSMKPNAIRLARWHANRRCAEVDAMRTVHGVAPDEPLGPVLRAELWKNRAAGDGLALITLAERLEAIADDEGVAAAEIAERYDDQQIKPHRMSAGERLAALVTPDPERPDWAEEAFLVRMIEPLSNGTLNQAYLRIVRDSDGTEFVLVQSYDGSEPLAWPHDQAGLMAGYEETLTRVRAAAQSADQQHFAPDATSTGPWTQEMSDADFLAVSGQMHLV